MHVDATVPSEKKTKKARPAHRRPERGSMHPTRYRKTEYARTVEAHESTSSTSKITTTTCAGKGYNSMNQLQCGSQVHSYAADHENPGCKGSSGQGMEEARNDSSMAAGRRSRAKRRLHLSPQACGVRTTGTWWLDTSRIWLPCGRN